MQTLAKNNSVPQTVRCTFTYKKKRSKWREEILMSGYVSHFGYVHSKEYINNLLAH
jgi:hypothetical protein